MVYFRVLHEMTKRSRLKKTKLRDDLYIENRVEVLIKRPDSVEELQLGGYRMSVYFFTQAMKMSLMPRFLSSVTTGDGTWLTRSRRST
jgi:hypothetical protein